MSGCEKKLAGAGSEREREVAERGTERGSGVTEIGLSGERKFCRSRSAPAPLTCSGCNVVDRPFMKPYCLSLQLEVLCVFDNDVHGNDSLWINN